MKASILINNYNYKPYVTKAITSCLSQTYRDIEVILYDDGSTDGSLDEIDQFSDKITIMPNKNYSKGHCWNQINAVNEAFKKSNGEIIFLLDSDDWFFPDKVEKVMKIFKEKPELVAVQHPFQLVDENDKFLPRLKRPIFTDINILEAMYFTKRQDFFFTQTSGLCFQRSFLEKTLPLPEDDLPLICVDIRLSRMAMFAGKIHTIGEKLAAYRIHTLNHSSALKDAAYLQQYDVQHVEFFNRLARANNLPDFKTGNNIISYFKVLLQLVKSGMKPDRKIAFLKSWVNSYLQK
jgi:glycosyltransferase involved in cell wall biosynthesis